MKRANRSKKKPKRKAAAPALSKSARAQQKQRRAAARSPEDVLALCWALRLAQHADEVGVPLLSTRAPEAVRDAWGRGCRADALPAAIARATADVGEVPLRQACRRLGAHVGLSDLEIELVAFAVALQLSRPLADMMRLLEVRTARELSLALSAALLTSRSAVERALSSSSLASQTGLLWTDLGAYGDRSAPLRTHWPVEDALLGPPQSDEELLALLVQRDKPSTLTAADFPHLASALDSAVALLRGAAQTRAAGVHVLLAGPPGTGKTELARLLLSSAGLAPFAVPASDGAEAVQGPARLRRYALTQQVLRQRSGVGVVFDEIEDGIPKMNGDGAKKESKAFLHALFETDPLPAVFITNDPDALDPSVVRRFDLVIDVGVPPLPLRRAIAAQALVPVGASTELLSRLAHDGQLAPALVTRAARAVTIAGQHGDDAIDTFLDGTLRALGGGHGGDADDWSFDPALCASSPDASTLVARVAAGARGALLLTGPTGVGRRALARALMAAAGLQPLHLSWPQLSADGSLLARAFHAVARQGAALLVEEADDVLTPPAASQASRHAVRSFFAALRRVQSDSVRRRAGLIVLVADEPVVVDSAVAAQLDLRVALRRPSAAQLLGLVQRALRLLSAHRRENDAVDANALPRGLVHADVVAAWRAARFLGPDDESRRAAFWNALHSRAPERSIGFAAPRSKLSVGWAEGAEAVRR